MRSMCPYSFKASQLSRLIQATVVVAATLGVSLLVPATVFGQDLSGEISLRYLRFSETSGATQDEAGATVTPRLYWENNRGFRILAQPVVSWTADAEDPIYINPNQTYLRFSTGNLDATLGSNVVFWGVSEGAQLSDILNQRDLVSDFRGKDKIGRPMLRLGWGEAIARLDLFYLPLFQERRLRNAPLRLGNIGPNDTDNTLWPNDKQDHDPAVAARVTATLENFELGAYGYRGLNIDPSYLSGLNGSRSVYETTIRLGGDIQWNHADLILKYEGRYDSDAPTTLGTFEKEVSHLVGTEYILYNVFQSEASLTAITEYATSSIPDRALNPFQNDMLLGLRAELDNLSSTEITFAYSHDFTYGSDSFEIELQTRLTDNAALDLFYTDTSNIDGRDPYRGLRTDSHFSFSLVAAF